MDAAVLILGLVATVLSYAVVACSRMSQETSRGLLLAVVALKDKDAAIVMSDAASSRKARTETEAQGPQSGVGPSDWQPTFNDIDHTSNGA